MRPNPQTGGTAHFLACGCRACKDRMQREFARILDASYDMNELLDVVELSQAHQFITDFNVRTDLLVERINAYGGA